MSSPDTLPELQYLFGAHHPPARFAFTGAAPVLRAAFRTGRGPDFLSQTDSGRDVVVVLEQVFRVPLSFYVDNTIEVVAVGAGYAI